MGASSRVSGFQPRALAGQACSRERFAQSAWVPPKARAHAALLRRSVSFPAISFPDNPQRFFLIFTKVRIARIIPPITVNMSSTPLPGPELCTEAEITRLVHGFYAQVRLDPMLGPIFNEHVADWPAHLDLLVDFWSAMLRGTRRFRGAPMSKHLVLPGLSQELFAQWLRLFHQVTATLGNPAMQAQADDMAERIAETFWQRYRLQNQPSLPTIRVPASR